MTTFHSDLVRTIERLPSSHLMVWKVLGSGRKNATTSEEIREKLEKSFGIIMPDTTLRVFVKGMIEDFGLPIGSTPNKPAGFYVIETEEEMDAVVRSLYSRAFSILRRVSLLKRIPMFEAYRQMNLEFDKDHKTVEGGR